MNIFPSLSRSRDKPQNRTSGSGYSFFFGGSTAGKNVNERSAMQMTAVYSCVRILAEAVAGLPLHLYRYKEDGGKEKALDHPLYNLLHDEPNPEMSSFVFRETLMTHLLLWGNAYAQIIRDSSGDLISLWPLSPDQTEVFVDKNGQVAYKYQKDGQTYILGVNDVFHIKDIGNGLIGLSKLSFMSYSVKEATDTQKFATANAENYGKPSGILTVDHILKKDKNGVNERDRIRQSLYDFRTGGSSKIVVLEADMKFNPVTLTPEESQLIENRRFSVEEICRWFGVPPVLIGASGATTWGSGISEITSGFVKFTIGPMLVSIEQALRSRVFTFDERMTMQAEFSLDALMRGDITSRYQAYATAVQNGFKTRNEVRQLENDEPVEGGDVLTAQTNLAPLDKLGQVTGGSQTQITDIKQWHRSKLRLL